MKNFKIFILLLFVATPFLSIAQEQEEKDVNPKKMEAEFRVEGNCGMCKKRIEDGLDIKGVRFAEWNKETKMLKVVYNSEKISLDEIKERTAEVGHDNADYKASDKTYDNLHGCCKYR